MTGRYKTHSRITLVTARAMTIEAVLFICAIPPAFAQNEGPQSGGPTGQPLTGLDYIIAPLGAAVLMGAIFAGLAVNHGAQRVKWPFLVGAGIGFVLGIVYDVSAS